MEVQDRLLSDNGNLVQSILEMRVAEDELVPVEITLPDYVDITSLLALQKRMVDAAKITGRKLRLVASTKNLTVEKYATRIFADRDDIFLTVNWRDDA